MAIPTFYTERLVLKQVTEADIPSYQKHFNNYEIIKHLNSNVPWPYPNNGVEEHLKTTVFPSNGISNWHWGIYLRSNNSELIGCIGLVRDGSPENRGFWLAQKYWNRGIMSEALEPITNFAFSELGFEKLVLSNAKGNIASRRLKEKAGAILIETVPYSFVEKSYKESEVWHLTKHNWQHRES